MSDTFFIAIVPAADKVDMDALAASCFGADAEFRCSVSKTGTGSPSHYVVAGWWNPTFLTNVTLGHWKKNNAPTPGYSWKKDKDHSKPGLDAMAMSNGKTQPHNSTKLTSIMSRMHCCVGSALPEDPADNFLVSNDTVMRILNEFEDLKVIQGSV